MSAAARAPLDRRRLGHILDRLSSNFDGEALAAGRRPAAIVRAAGVPADSRGPRRRWGNAMKGASGPAFIDFAAVNRAALAVLPNLLRRWLPGGKRCGREYIARNPRRADRNLGSFSINVRTGRWADFATGDKGGDVIGLRAFLIGADRRTAATELSVQLGVGARRGR